MPKKPTKQTSNTVSSLASGVLSGRIKPTPKQVKSLAASALGQDEHKGKRR
jgi:phosphatidylglycerophosphatase A